ncbi:Fur family transcriptional regulator [Arthrobacter sp. NEB 688]|uniref:Fur family transcriptional regulator n=1 Tax=Arthrobacter sp. NEB 688 TaxID=904039 RepID=UPI001563C254|nr:Fur family transcriptional regulator [Arthrobacter sp. NEB 688]QKE85551.1 transcriptional repressor [Arthrobacter sp. NEB 688]
MPDPGQAVGDADLRRLLHDKRLRATPAGLAVLRVLARTHDHHHLTAAQIHQRLRADDPDVPAATVLRELRILTDAGLAHTLHDSDGTASHGIVLAPHHHVACTLCGVVHPLPTTTLHAALAQVSKVGRLSFEGDTIVLHGICPACRRRPRGPVPAGPGATDAPRAR